MKINCIKLTSITVPRHTGFNSQHVVVELTAEEHTGIGEMSDLSHLPRYMPDLEDLERVLNHLLLDQDARNIEPINALMLESFPAAHDYYDKGNFIRCGVDIALHDLVANSLGEPVSTLLGGRARERFKVCYPIFRHRTHNDIPASLQTVERRLEQGFDIIRLYVGSNVDADVNFLDQLTQRFGGGVKVKSLDFSHSLDWKDTRSALQHFKRFEFSLIESPAHRNDIKGLAKFRDSVDVPVSEHVWSMHGLTQMIQHDAVDILNIAPIFIGGLSAARKTFSVAHAAGKRCLIGTTQELSIGTAAQAQLGAAMVNLSDISDPTGPVLYTEDVVKSSIRYEGGYLIVPPDTEPGLGIALDRKRLKRHTAPLAWETVSVASVLDRTLTA